MSEGRCGRPRCSEDRYTFPAFKFTVWSRDSRSGVGDARERQYLHDISVLAARRGKNGDIGSYKIIAFIFFSG